jgi:Arc/MetJ-type ribon-helix-helix transcriptional regulator
MDREFTSVSDYIRELVINDRERLKVKARCERKMEWRSIPGSTYTKRLR